MYWSGITKKRITNLSPGILFYIRFLYFYKKFNLGEIIDINLLACFSSPGIYNLNRFRFVVENNYQKTNTNTVVFVFPTQYLVTIEELVGPQILTETQKLPSPKLNPSILSPRNGLIFLLSLYFM